MADFILITGDKAVFQPNFGAAVVVVQPAEITGSATATFSGKNICVDGDEESVFAPGCVYITAQYSIPGSGTLVIESLAGDQKAQKTYSNGKAVLLKGNTFTAKFEVQTPAQQPPPGPGAPIPDSTPHYSGSGMFVTMNTKLKGS